MRTSTLLSIGLATLTVAAPAYSNHEAREAPRECQTDKDCGGGYKCLLPDSMAIMTEEKIPGMCQQLGGPRKPGMEDKNLYKMEVPGGAKEKTKKEETANKDEEKAVKGESAKTEVSSPEKNGDSAGNKNDQSSGGFREDKDEDEDCDEEDEDDWEDCDENEDDEDDDDDDCDEDEDDDVIIGGTPGAGDKHSGNGNCVMKDAQGQMQLQVCMTDEQIAKECKEVKDDKCIVKEQGDSSAGSGSRTTEENPDKKTNQKQE